MKYLFAFLMLTAVAQAQTVTTTVVSLCFADGMYFPARNGLCFSEDRQRITTTTGVTVSAKPAPQCEDGWSLVDAGRPMCARELKEPK